MKSIFEWDTSFGQDDHLGLSTHADPTPFLSNFAHQEVPDSIELIIVIVMLLLAVGIACTASKLVAWYLNWDFIVSVRRPGSTR
jgi:hypothetical protein